MIKYMYNYLGICDKWLVNSNKEKTIRKLKYLNDIYFKRID